MINLVQSDFLSFKGQNVVTPWDRLKKHIFNAYPVHTTEKVQDEDKLLQIGLKYQAEADMVWVVEEGVKISEDFPWHYRPGDTLSKLLIHEFPRVTSRSRRPLLWGDVRLVPTGGVAHGTTRNRIICSQHEADFDIVMLSYHEAEADSKYQKLLQRFPDAKHIKNVKGIGAAHKEAARIADSQCSVTQLGAAGRPRGWLH